MALGPGKYDAACTRAREETGSAAVVLIVIGGKHGSGFSVQSLGEDLTRKLPDVLEGLAQQIRSDIEQGASHG